MSAPVTPAELRAAAEQFGDPRSAANVLIPPAAAGLLLAAADALEAAERRVARLATAAAAAVRWFEDVKPHLEGQAGFLHVHGMNYAGRTDAPEIFAALAALDEVEP